MLFASFLLQLVNRRRVLDNATDLIEEHDDDEDAEKDTEEDADAGEHPRKSVLEQGAVRVQATALVGPQSDEDDRVPAAQEDVDEEEQEVLLVRVADAVVHPRAVVVHAGDASATGRAVMALRSLQRHAFLALLRKEAIELSDLNSCQVAEV